MDKLIYVFIFLYFSQKCEASRMQHQLNTLRGRDAFIFGNTLARHRFYISTIRKHRTAHMAISRYRDPTSKPAWYKARQRSITPAQKATERLLWPLYGLSFSYNRHLDLGSAFVHQPTAPVVLEIGCGIGEAIVELAAARPDANFLGVDWYRSGLASCCKELKRRSLQNVRLVRADALTMLEQGLPPSPCLDEVLIYFPDPWYGSPERRMVRPDVITSLGARLKPGGVLHIATDVPGYPEAVRELFASASFSQRWQSSSCSGRLRPSTRYEREAIEAGRAIEDLCFVRCELD